MAATDPSSEIDDILVDCYDEDEMFTAWEVAFEDRVAVPFSAGIFGAPVEVRGFRVAGHQMQCRVSGSRQERWVGIDALDSAGLPDDFTRLFELFRSWSAWAE